MLRSLDRFAKIRADLLGVLGRFPSDRVEEVAFDAWSLKDMIAHLAGWDRFFVDMVAQLKAGQEVAMWGDFHAYNKASVEERADHTWDQVRDELAETGEAFLETYGALVDDLWHQPFWEGMEDTPVSVVAINIHHYGEHLAEIVGQLRAWEAK